MSKIHPITVSPYSTPLAPPPPDKKSFFSTPSQSGTNPKGNPKTEEALKNAINGGAYPGANPSRVSTPSQSGTNPKSKNNTGTEEALRNGINGGAYPRTNQSTPEKPPYRTVPKVQSLPTVVGTPNAKSTSKSVNGQGAGKPSSAGVPKPDGNAVNPKFPEKKINLGDGQHVVAQARNNGKVFINFPNPSEPDGKPVSWNVPGVSTKSTLKEIREAVQKMSSNSRTMPFVFGENNTVESNKRDSRTAF